MKKIKIESQPAVLCPVSKKLNTIENCRGCDAFKGLASVKAKDKPIPVAVKCIIDEF